MPFKPKARARDQYCDACIEDYVLTNKLENSDLRPDYCVTCRKVISGSITEGQSRVLVHGDVLDIALEAMCAMAKAKICSFIPGSRKLSYRHLMESEQLAFLAGYLNPQESLPMMFASDMRLYLPFEFAQSKRHRDEAVRIAADWNHYQLPVGQTNREKQKNLPVKKLQKLNAGDFVKICGHTVAIGHKHDEFSCHLHDDCASTCAHSEANHKQGKEAA